MSKESEILEGLHYSILEKWIATGKVDTLPEGMEQYMQHLTAVLGWHNRSFNKTQIIKRLRVTFHLDYYQAKNRYVDGLNYFYLDTDIKYDAYMSIYADKLDKITDLIIQSATTPDEALQAVKSIKEAAALREKIKPKETVPEELFKRPNKVYTLQLEDLGVHESVDRNKLAKLIDSMETLEESEKIRVKQEASLEPRIFNYHEQKAED
ncbi:hypothetical protein [Tenacibaculum halocynthiae]|uniref:hypothetical protein n=1 Tax=Tenacibaculum halocynthiae TaxID=1254437 RepID=UPI003895DF86